MVRQHAMADLLGADAGWRKSISFMPVTICCWSIRMCFCSSHLVGHWRDLFNADFDVLLYDLTSTYSEVNASDLPEGTSAITTCGQSGRLSRL